MLDEYEVAALMIHSDIEVAYFRQVVQALKFFTGIGKVCEPYSRWPELGKGYGKVYTGVFFYDEPEKKNTKEKLKEISCPGGRILLMSSRGTYATY